MIWHCPTCRKEWTTDDDCAMHAHRCAVLYEDLLPRPRRLPLDPVARGAYWRELLEPTDSQGENT